MPFLQAMGERANIALNRHNIPDCDYDALEHLGIIDILDALGVTTNTLEREYIDAWPSALKAAIRSILLDAVRREQPVAVAWAPAYDFELRVFEARGTEETPGGITMLLHSPYPDI